MALERNSCRQTDRLPEETIIRVYEAMELSSDCITFTSLSELVDLIRNTKRIEPRPIEEDYSLKREPTTVEENEKILRKCVKTLVEKGNDGIKLAASKKIVWKRLKFLDVRLEDEEGERLLMEYYWLVM